MKGRRCRMHLLGKPARPSQDYFPWYMYYGYRSDSPSVLLPVGAIRHWPNCNGIWQRAEYLYCSGMAVRVFAVSPSRTACNDRGRTNHRRHHDSILGMDVRIRYSEATLTFLQMDFGFYFLDPNDIAWRFPLAFQIVFCIFILAFVLSLPESPRWLVFAGREDEALNVLGALSNSDPDSQFVKEEFYAIKDTVLEASTSGWRDLFTMGEDRHFHRVVLAYVNQVFQQISGINLITYVSTKKEYWSSTHTDLLCATGSHLCFQADSSAVHSKCD